MKVGFKKLQETSLILGALLLSVLAHNGLAETLGGRSIYSNKAYQHVNQADLDSALSSINKSELTANLSEKEKMDLAYGSILLAAHFDRIAMNPPFFKFTEIPKERLNHYYRSYFWVYRIHARDTDECVLRRIVEGSYQDGKESVLAEERQQMENDPSFKCRTSFINPKKNIAFPFAASDWLTPLPDLSHRASKEEVEKFRAENSPENFLKANPSIKDLALQARAKGRIDLSFRGDPIPFFSSEDMEPLAQTEVRIADQMRQYVEQSKFIKTSNGLYHAQPLPSTFLSSGWGGVTLKFETAPRNLAEVREQMKLQLTQYYIAMKRSEFMRGLSMGKHKNDIDPRPSEMDQKIKSTPVIEANARFSILQISAKEALNKDQQKKLRDLLSNEFKNLVPSANLVASLESDMKSQLIEALPEVEWTSVSLKDLGSVRNLFSELHPIPTDRLGNIQYKMLKNSEAARIFAETRMGMAILYASEVVRSEARGIDPQKDQPDYSQAERVMRDEKLWKVLSSDLVAVFGKEDADKKFQPSNVAPAMIESGVNASGLNSEIAQTLKTFLSSAEKSRFFGSLILDAKNLPGRFVCADPAKVLPTCEYTQREWDKMSAK